MLPVGQHAVLFLDFGPDAGQEFLFDCERVGRRWRIRFDLARNVPVRHHDDHGLGFSISQQVVHDYVGAPGPGPGRLNLSIAVQQIEHGIFPGSARLIAGRRVDVKHPGHAELL